MRRDESSRLQYLHLLRHMLFDQLIRIYSGYLIKLRDKKVYSARYHSRLFYYLGGYNEFQYFSRKINYSFSVHGFLLLLSLIVYGNGVSALTEIADKEFFVIALAEPQSGDLSCLDYIVEKLLVSVDPGFVFNIRHKNDVARHNITP